MRIASFSLLLLLSCSEDDLSPPTDAGIDQTTSDASTNDTGTKKDAGIESGSDGTASDGTVDDGSADATGDGSSDAPDDSSDAADDGASDAGDDGSSDGGICPPCMMGYACCTIMKSFNYGKCYDPKCLACCM